MDLFNKNKIQSNKPATLRHLRKTKLSMKTRVLPRLPPCQKLVEWLDFQQFLISDFKTKSLYHLLLTWIVLLWQRAAWTHERIHENRVRSKYIKVKSFYRRSWMNTLAVMTIHITRYNNVRGLLLCNCYHINGL